MFSLVQKQALALVLASGLVSASGSSKQASMYEDSIIDSTDLQRNATVKLWAENHLSSPGSARCNENAPSNTITLAPEVCLSGDYYLDHNFQITEQPLCPNGEFPVMVFYHSRGCTGDVKYHSTFDNPPPTTCLWESSPKYWSMVFRCGVWATLQVGADHHVAAVPPKPNSSAQSDVAVSGTVLTYLAPACNGQRVGGRKPITLPVDKCLSTHGYSLRMTKPAVCANGTRALWARFEGSKCNYGEITNTDGLLDIDDKDVGLCKDTGNFATATKKIGSMSFWCDGFGDVKRPDPNAPPEKEEPRPQKGSVSESACGNTAPFFKHPETDTCVNLRTNKLKIYSSGVCQNGTTALWARYSEKNCVGSPASLSSVAEDEMKRCLDVSDTSSFSFWCTGEGLGTAPPATPKTPNKAKSGGMPAFLIVVLSLMGVVLLAFVAFLAFAFRDRLNAMFRRDGAIAL
ncbi:hypothetical protein LSUE1_G006888 [Lachnellula suecica]|uniref:Uncharacterized protein n=1 Tax=Lachnellula suecica TaxID=602035 RepID=A0A8T9C408_9HELO|nr:hypothetical protein LSUE1_G006888 [Lachnellula suecica]